MRTKTTKKTEKNNNQKRTEKKITIVKPRGRKDIMTTEEVCEFLDIVEETLYKWVHNDFIPCIKLSRKKWLFNRSSISQWLCDKEKGCGFFNKE